MKQQRQHFGAGTAVAAHSPARLTSVSLDESPDPPPSPLAQRNLRRARPDNPSPPDALPLHRCEFLQKIPSKDGAGEAEGSDDGSDDECESVERDLTAVRAELAKDGLEPGGGDRVRREDGGLLRDCLFGCHCARARRRGGGLRGGRDAAFAYERGEVGTERLGEQGGRRGGLVGHGGSLSTQLVRRVLVWRSRA